MWRLRGLLFPILMLVLPQAKSGVEAKLGKSEREVECVRGIKERERAGMME